jgi:ABC-type glycerol-3-phosphate transport system permease component
MNALHVILLALLAGFVILYAKNPRNPSTAIAYGRVVLLAIASVVVLSPFVWLVTAVFKDPTVLNEYIFAPPPSEWSEKTVNLKNFEELFAGKSTVQGTIYFWQYLLNSIVLASVTTVLQLFFVSLAGYALAKFDFRGKLPLMVFMLGSMMIPHILLLAPVYQMVVDLGMVDTYVGLVLPGLVSAYGIFLFRQAIMSVPDEMIDAGRIDGCSEFGIYFKLIMPLVRPMAAAFCLVAFLGSWNSYLGPNVFLHSKYKLTLPVVLNLYIGQYQNQYGVFLAGTLLAIIPPAILFFALQKEFVSGLTSGAVKG